MNTDPERKHLFCGTEYKEDDASMKKIFAILLSMLLIFSLLPFTAAAEEAEEYPLWVGGIRVTSANQTSLGAGISYDGGDTCGTLLLDSASLSGSCSEDWADGAVICSDADGFDLTIDVTGTCSLSGGTRGIVLAGSGSSLTITGTEHDVLSFADDGTRTGLIDVNGSLVVEGTEVNAWFESGEDYLITAGDAEVRGGASLKLRNGSGRGIATDSGKGSGAFTVSDSEVSVRTGSQTCLFADGMILVTGTGCLTLNVSSAGDPILLVSGDWYDQTAHFNIEEPDHPALMNADGGWSIYDKAKAIWAPHIELTARTSYPVWVGSTQVTPDNKDNVLGDGKVSFDPASGTLSLNGVTGISGTTANANGYSASIYAYGMNLNIAVTDGLTLKNSAERGISVYDGSLTITGDLDMDQTASSSGLSVTAVGGGGNITINGNSVIRSGAECIGAGGSLTITGDVFEYQAAKSKKDPEQKLRIMIVRKLYGNRNRTRLNGADIAALRAFCKFRFGICQ